MATSWTARSPDEDRGSVDLRARSSGDMHALVLEVESAGAMKLITPLVVGLGGRQERRNLGRLKRLLEERDA